MTCRSDSSPIEKLEDRLRSQVRPSFVSRADRQRFPTPLGAWLVCGNPSVFRKALRACGVTPAGLVLYWILKYPVSLPVASYSQEDIAGQYRAWSQEVRNIYVKSRQSLVSLVEVRGVMSEATRLACARYGAWAAVAALEAEKMPRGWLSWAGLKFDVKAQGFDYCLVSDNYGGKLPEGATVYAAAEAQHCKGLTAEEAQLIHEIKVTWPGSVVEYSRPARLGSR